MEQAPPLAVTGMINITLDARGSLLRFVAVAPQVVSNTPAPITSTPDWQAVLAESGLDLQRFNPEEPVWIPPVVFDASAGWKGSYVQNPSTVIHVIVAAFRGKVVYFEVVGPWTHPTRDRAAPQSSTRTIASNALLGAYFLVIVAGLWLALRNRRLGRGDLDGAFRVAAFTLVAGAPGFLLGRHHVADPGAELGGGALYTGVVLFIAASIWLMYMALEPFVRRLWPELLISWSRLVAGKFTDPLVGRDVLIGTLAGAVVYTAHSATEALPWLFDVRGETPAHLTLYASNAEFLAHLMTALAFCSLNPLFSTLVLFLARVVCRRTWLAVLVAWIAFVTFGLGRENWMLELPMAIVVGSANVYLAGRRGILALTAFWLFGILVDFAPPDPSRWYAIQVLAPLAITAGLAIYGFKIALGGKPAFGTNLLGDET